MQQPCLLGIDGAIDRHRHRHRHRYRHRYRYRYRQQGGMGTRTLF